MVPAEHHRVEQAVSELEAYVVQNEGHASIDPNLQLNVDLARQALLAYEAANGYVQDVAERVGLTLPASD